MPGFAVHYLFGEELLKDYDNNYVKKCINRHQEVYNMGLQGPDLFFYFFLSPVLYKKNIGSIMHTKDVGAFKSNFIKSIKDMEDKDKSMIAISYFAGFLGHCTLDKICHPYVYAVTDYEHKGKDYFSKHVDLETDIDSMYISKYKDMDLYYFRRKETLNISNVEIEVLAEVFVKAFKKTYSNVKLSKKRMELVINIFKQSSTIFNDKHGVKKSLVGFLEKIILKRKVISPMFIVEKHIQNEHDVLNKENQKWYNPWEKDIIRDESFPELFKYALKEYSFVLDELNNYLINGNENVLKRTIENISLHSGLDCSIPS
ncbi:MAG: zinc dependent phospholipase C family protein [Lachnospiraceae bacterium]|nr:zinc dependent phospholipase C family protein [Lachnospiraceae bacterium]